jgi:hypothetical protein
MDAPVGVVRKPVVPCIKRDKCTNPTCTFHHFSPGANFSFEGDPSTLTRRDCNFGAKCNKATCIFQHPSPCTWGDAPSRTSSADSMAENGPKRPQRPMRGLPGHGPAMDMLESDNLFHSSGQLAFLSPMQLQQQHIQQQPVLSQLQQFSTMKQHITTMQPQFPTLQQQKSRQFFYQGRLDDVDDVDMGENSGVSSSDLPSLQRASQPARSKASARDEVWEIKRQQALAATLMHSTALTSLDLSNNTLRCEGAAEIVATITQLVALIRLNVEGNELGSHGLKTLMAGVTRLTGLTSLNLCRNELSADDCALVCGAASGAGMTQLCELEAEGNGFSAASVVGCEGWRAAGLSCSSDSVFFASSFSVLMQYAVSEDRVSFADSNRHPLLPAALLRRIESSDSSLTSVEIEGAWCFSLGFKFGEDFLMHRSQIVDSCDFTQRFCKKMHDGMCHRDEWDHREEQGKNNKFQPTFETAYSDHELRRETVLTELYRSIKGLTKTLDHIQTNFKGDDNALREQFNASYYLTLRAAENDLKRGGNQVFSEEWIVVVERMINFCMLMYYLNTKPCEKQFSDMHSKSLECAQKFILLLMDAYRDMWAQHVMPPNCEEFCALSLATSALARIATNSNKSGGLAALCRVYYELPSHIRQRPPVQRTLEVLLCYFSDNITRFFELLDDKRCPYLVALICSGEFYQIRFRFLKNFFATKLDKVPFEALARFNCVPLCREILHSHICLLGSCFINRQKHKRRSNWS